MSAPEGAQQPTGASILRTALRRNVGAMAQGTVLMSLYQVAETAFPIALGMIVEYAFTRRGVVSLVISLGILAVLITIVALSWRSGMRILQRANTTEAHRWRVQVAAVGLAQVERDVDLQSGEVLTIATDDADQTADIVEVVPLLVSSLVAVLVAAVALGISNVWLGVLVVAGTAAILSVTAVLSRRIGAGTKEQQVRVARASAKVADLITGLRALRGFGGSYPAFQSFCRVSADAQRQATAVAGLNGLYTGIAAGLNALLAAAVMLSAGWFALVGEITVGQLVAAVGLAQFIAQPLRLLADTSKYVMTARASAERMAILLGAPPRRNPGGELAPPSAELEVAGGSANAGWRFRVQRGEFIGVVAATAGASAGLPALLAGREANGASARIGGRNVADLAVDSLRERILVDPPEAQIFAGTLRANIDPLGAATNLPATLKAAVLSDVVDAHADGLDYRIADRGSNLSGGQRQRLALARALAANPYVLVLQDPTSAVDAVTEQLIAQRIVQLRRGLTTIVLTRSPALLDAADRVLVLGDGDVSAEGTHRELLAADETYRALVAR